MISLTTTKITMDSLLLKGARVHLRKFTVDRHTHVTIALANPRAKLGSLYREWGQYSLVPDETDETGKVTKPGDSAEIREDKIVQRMRLQGEIDALTQINLKAAILCEYVESIEGVELDGEPMTPEMLVTTGPPTFADEVYAFLEANNGLPPFVAIKSPSPPPSPTAEDGNIPIPAPIPSQAP
jgi:hypothetical protein